MNKTLMVSTTKRMLNLILISYLVVAAYSFNSIQSARASGNQAYYADSLEIGTPFGFTHAGYSCSDAEYELLKRVGNHWNRIDFSWSSIEKANGTWDYSFFDAYVAKANEHGVNILAILNYGHPKTGDGLFYLSKENIPFFLEYVNKTVNRYRNNVSAFEIWNEPNYEAFWKGTPEEFFYLFNQTAELIYSIDPQIKIVGPAFAGYSGDYLEQMFKAGVMNRVHAISFHPYITYPEALYQKIIDLRALMAKYGFKGELWITEIGNPTGGIYGHSVGYREQADRVIKSLIYTTITNISVNTWYTLYDYYYDSALVDPLNSENFFGVINYRSGVWKPGAYSFSLFSNHTTNSRFFPNAIIKNGLFSESINAYLYRKDNGLTTLFLWADDTLTTYSKIKIEIAIPNNSSAVFMHNIYNGSALVVSSVELSDLAINGTPVMISFYADSNASMPLTIRLKTTNGWSIYMVGFPILMVLVIAVKKESIKKVYDKFATRSQ